MEITNWVIAVSTMFIALATIAIVLDALATFKTMSKN